MQYHYPARVLYIHDGDTWHFIVDQGLDTERKLKVRLLGIDCAELSSEEGKKIRDLLRLTYPVGTPVELVTERDRTEKYGRYLATVFVGQGSQRIEVNQWLLDNTMAKPYSVAVQMGLARYASN